jgi:hypothetical protein
MTSLESSIWANKGRLVKKENPNKRCFIQINLCQCKSFFKILQDSSAKLSLDYLNKFIIATDLQY